MTVESITFYINKAKDPKVTEYLNTNDLTSKLSLVDKEDAGMKVKQKIKSKELLNRKEFENLIDFLKDNNSEMLNVTLYLNTDGNVRLMEKLEEYYKEEKSVDMVIDSTQLQKIFTHTDLDDSVTDFIKNFERNIPLMERLYGFNAQTFFRVNITGLRAPNGYENAWNFLKDVGIGAYFMKPK